MPLENRLLIVRDTNKNLPGRMTSPGPDGFEPWRIGKINRLCLEHLGILPEPPCAVTKHHCHLIFLVAGQHGWNLIAEYHIALLVNGPAEIAVRPIDGGIALPP